MKPIIKKAAAAIAIKEGVEKIQEMRKPKKPSIMQRLMPFTIVAAIAGLGLFLYKNKVSNDTNGSYNTTGSNGSTGTF